MDLDSTNLPKVWVDADACPVTIKQIIFRTAERIQIEVILVANQSIWVPSSKYIRAVTVQDGADIADRVIVQQLQPGDLVVTGDIPLAAAAVNKGAIAIGVRGELFDEATVHHRLASRNLMDQLRAAGVETSGPKPHGPKDVQTFSNQLDRTLTKLRQRSAGG